MNGRERIYNSRSAEVLRKFTDSRFGIVIMALGSAACLTGSAIHYEAGEYLSAFDLSIGAVLMATAAVAGKINRNS